jgi:hypothetical protein
VSRAGAPHHAGRRVRWLARALVLALAAGAPACDAPAPEAEIPAPSLAGVEREVAAAIAAARDAVAAGPREGKAWGKLGDLLFGHDFKSEAARCYAQAEALDPESFLWPYRGGWCLLQEEPERAAESLERSLRSLDS